MMSATLQGLPPRGILGVLWQTLKEIGWAFYTPTSFITKDDIEIDLAINPPAEVKASLTKAFEARLDELHQGRLLAGTPPLDWGRLRTALRSRRWQPAAKGVLLQAYSGHLVSRTWAFKQGYPLDPYCPCGQVDDPPHRLQGCEHTHKAKQSWEPKDLEQAICHLARPRPTAYQELTLKKNGVEIDMSEV
jgi:hypothetical protein